MHINQIIDSYPYHTFLLSTYISQQHPNTNMLSHFLFSVGIFMIVLASSSQVLVDAFTLSPTTISSRLRPTSMSSHVSTTGTIIEMIAVCNMIESPTLVKEDTPVLVTSSTTIQERSNNYADKSNELNDDDESYEM